MTLITTFLLIALTGALCVIALTAVLNALTFPRLRRAPAPAGTLAVLIPARNEAHVIGQTVRAVLAEPAVTELVLLDDHSTDGTAEAARAAAAGDPRLRVLAGAPLPAGWLGKNWACHQLSQAAHSDHLLFADADVRWEPGALAAVLAAHHHLRADLLTVWPTQHTISWGERLTVPLMALAIMGYLPVLAVHHVPLPVFAAAMGQCLLFRRAAYAQVGGHAAVRGDIVEDVALARRIKQAGLRLRMADGNQLVTCRMYTNWPQARDGFAKNILRGHGGTVALALSTVFHLAAFVLPWVLFVLALLTGGAAHWPLAWVALGVGARALTAASTHQRVGDAVLMPLSALLMTRIAWQAWRWHRTGGPRWKGRVAAV